MEKRFDNLHFHSAKERYDILPAQQPTIVQRMPLGMIASILTPVAAFCLAAIMIPAAIIHYRRKEPKNVVINLVILSICGIIAIYRI